jgi:transposase
VIYNYFYGGLNRSEISRKVQVRLPFVDRWKRRWLQSELELVEWFSQEDKQGSRGPKADRDFVLSLVEDAPRSGTPAKYSEEVRAQVIALALTKPSDEGIPIERWSHELLAKYVVKKGISKEMSSTRVGDFLKSAPSTT